MTRFFGAFFINICYNIKLRENIVKIRMYRGIKLKSLFGLNRQDNRIQSDLKKANMYSLRCIWISQICITVSWILDMMGIFIVDKNLVTTAFVGVTIMFILTYIVKGTIGFDTKIGSYLTLFILIAIISFANIFLSYHTTMFMLFPMLCAALYSEKEYINFAFCLTAIGMFLAVVLGFKIGLCDANMLVLTISNSSYEAEIIRSGNAVINDSIISLIIYYFVPRFFALVGFTFLVNYIKTNISERTAKEMEIKRFAETDGLTGLFNRNKYNQMLEMGKSERVAIIYVDINNLKKINDSLGHEQGDVLILGMARILRGLQTERVKPYRLGGDEFVVAIDNPAEDEVVRVVDRIKKEMADAKLDYGLVLSAAIGYSQGARDNIDEIVKKADSNMYANKKAMKNIKK